MQTKCPHCETRFRLTQSQVDTADGYVRCGVCKEVFNANEVAVQPENQSENQLENQAPVNFTGQEKPAQSNSETDKTAVEINIELAAESHQDKLSNFEQSSDQVQAEKDTFDFFNDDNDDPSQHVVPEKFRTSDRDRSGGLVTTLLWSIATLFLCLTLMAEYTWFNRNQFSQFPELQSIFSKLCQHFECKDFAMRNPSKIELITRNVYSHPNEKDALMVNVTMKNTANFAQPYPVVQVDFSDVRGAIVAARRFFPEEYLSLQNDSEVLHLLQPDADASITLEIQDPGKQAMTYEFNFM